MTRVTKARVRQVILVDDEPIDPFYVPERMQFLRPDGTIVDPTKDNTKMAWRGDWDVTAAYNVNDVVRHNDALWIAPAGIGIGVEPAEAAGPALRTSHAYAFSNYDTPNTPIVVRDVAFAAADAVLTHGGGIWASGSRVISFDADPGSTVTITADHYVYGYKDTGSSGSGNSEMPPGGGTSHFSPWVFSMPTEGRMTVELPTGTSTITISGDGVAAGDLTWELIVDDSASGLPDGGTDGQVLTKASSTDGDADWENPASPSVEGWHDVGGSGEPAFANSWANLDGTHKAQFRKLPDGTVELRGLIDGGLATNTAFTLPSGYRPSGQDNIWFATATVSGGTWGTAIILIANDGAVVPMSILDGWVSLALRFGT